MVFKVAQTFYVDSAALKGASQCTISSISLCVKGKPLATNNKSGIAYPGLRASIYPCNSDGTPNLATKIKNAFAVREFNEIVASADASAETIFNYLKPVIVKTDAYYALVISADGDEDYTFWNCTDGEYYVSTNIITSGATVKYLGNYYEYTSSTANFPAQISVTTIGATQNTSISNWKPLKNTELKFSVSVALNLDVEPGSIVANSTNANTGNNVTYGLSYVLPNESYEFMTFDKYSYSSNTTSVPSDMVGKLVYQDTVVKYGPLTVRAGNTTVVSGNTINFNTLFNPVTTASPYIVLKDVASGTTVIRKIVDVQSNTQIMLDSAPGFNSNTCSFLVSPVAEITSVDDYWYSGNWWNGTVLSYIPNKLVNLAIMQNSSANSTVRFVNNHITSGTVSVPGSGYANTDYVVVSCGVAASLNAAANIVTSNTGAITSMSFSNVGYGLVNTLSYAIKNANNVPSTGSGATLTFTSGQNIKTASPTPASTFANVIFDNFEAHRLSPSIIILNNVNATIDTYQHFAYYVYPGAENTLLKLPVAARTTVVGGSQITPLTYNDGRLWVVPSRSNDVLFANTVIGATNANTDVISNTDIGNTAGCVTEYVIQSNNIFTVPCVVTPDLNMYQYVINNDATNERKHNGNALAKHISKKITFNTGQQAEDIVVVLQARRPPNTNINVYAKIYNSADTESFDDKDWTKLTVTTPNANTTTDINDASSFVEFQYGFKPYPTSYLTANGTATTTLNSNVVNGSVGSTYNTTFIASDIVKIYQPLFPQDYQIAVIDSIANSSQFTLKSAVSNTNIVGPNMNVDLIGRLANGANAEIGLPMQAFNNALNYNVVRYYNSALNVFDGYDSFAIKIVLLSSQRNVVPMIENVRAIGVTT